MKQILFLPFLLVTFLAAAQNLKPIPQMVADAGSDFQKLSLFSEKAENLTAAPEIGPALRTGTVLSWDAAQVQAVRALARRRKLSLDSFGRPSFLVLMA
jgi:hypothetical protein